MKRHLFLLLVVVTAALLALTTGPASATTPPGSITIANQAQLLTDGSVVLTVSYTCAPGPGGVTTGLVTSSVQQGAVIGSSGTNTATCDNRKHSANLRNVPGPFSRGTANALAVVENTNATSFATTSRGVMVN